MVEIVLLVVGTLCLFYLKFSGKTGVNPLAHHRIITLKASDGGRIQNISMNGVRVQAPLGDTFQLIDAESHNGGTIDDIKVSDVEYSSNPSPAAQPLQSQKNEMKASTILSETGKVQPK